MGSGTVDIRKQPSAPKMAVRRGSHEFDAQEARGYSRTVAPEASLKWLGDGARPNLENSTACQKSMPITSSRGLRSHGQSAGTDSSRTKILWLTTNNYLQLVVLAQSVKQPFNGSSFRRLACELNINGEFDPGSGRTLAACLTHASRTVNSRACSWGISGERVSNT